MDELNIAKVVFYGLRVTTFINLTFAHITAENQFQINCYIDNAIILAGIAQILRLKIKSLENEYREKA